MRRQRDLGLDCAVLFDGIGIRRQGRARARGLGGMSSLRPGQTHSLLPGVFLDWDRNDNTAFLLAVRRAEPDCAGPRRDTQLLAVDARWIARKPEVVINALKSGNQPVALVLVHRGDPLSEPRAVQGLRRVVQQVQRSVLASKRPRGYRGSRVRCRSCLGRIDDVDAPLHAPPARACPAATGTIGSPIRSSAGRLVPGQRCCRLDDRRGSHRLQSPLLLWAVARSIP